MSRQDSTQRSGIASIGLKLPSLYLPVADLAELRGIDPNKFTVGLGCREMALCEPGSGVVDLAVAAAERALARWPGKRQDIGLLAVGTESALDMSRPLSAWVADKLGLRGAIRSYEVKHACYGGTLALRQALEWRLSGAARGKAALVIAADVGLYAPCDPGEPTQGAGAVAMIVEEPTVAAVDPVSYAYSEAAFDFWRPVGQAFPSVDGPLSLDCYQRAAQSCFAELVGSHKPDAVLRGLSALCFHTPFPKMVRKAVGRLGEAWGLDAAQTEDLYASKIDPTMEWNRAMGNSYTASLWTAVAYALRGRARGERLAAFSYGSGFGAELLLLEAGAAAREAAWTADIDSDLSSRRRLSKDEYQSLRETTASH